MGSNMNKHESKYFNTALLMNESLVRLLDKKDYEFITVKEICEVAGVNRSTFYLHYESMNDLLLETIENMFNELKNRYSRDFSIEKIVENDELENLKLFTPEYSIPYLTFLKEHTLTIIVAYMIGTKTPTEKSIVMAIASATYAFFKISMAIKNLVKAKSVQDPIIQTIKNIGFVDALTSMLVLEATLISTFGEMTTSMYTIIGVSGAVIFSLIIALGIAMAVKGNRALRNL